MAQSSELLEPRKLLSSKSFLGYASPNAAVGDHIYIFWGSDMAVVLPKVPYKADGEVQDHRPCVHNTICVPTAGVFERAINHDVQAMLLKPAS